MVILVGCHGIYNNRVDDYGNKKFCLLIVYFKRQKQIDATYVYYNDMFSITNHV